MIFTLAFFYFVSFLCLFSVHFNFFPSCPSLFFHSMSPLTFFFPLTHSPFKLTPFVFPQNLLPFLPWCLRISIPHLSSHHTFLLYLLISSSPRPSSEMAGGSSREAPYICVFTKMYMEEFFCVCLAWRSSSVSEHLYTFDMKYEVSSLTRAWFHFPSLSSPPLHRSPAYPAVFVSTFHLCNDRLISLLFHRVFPYSVSAKD